MQKTITKYPKYPKYQYTIVDDHWRLFGDDHVIYTYTGNGKYDEPRFIEYNKGIFSGEWRATYLWGPENGLHARFDNAPAVIPPDNRYEWWTYGGRYEPQCKKL